MALHVSRHFFVNCIIWLIFLGFHFGRIIREDYLSPYFINSSLAMSLLRSQADSLFINANCLAIFTFFFWSPLVTIISAFMIMILLISEYSDYRQPEIKPELVVDKSRKEKLTINVNVTFPKVPCYRKFFFNAF